MTLSLLIVLSFKAPANPENSINSSAYAITLKQRSPSVVKLPYLVSMTMEKMPSQFQPIPQPAALKIAVIIIGLGLIILELWWFLAH
ncbi:MAG: hypothetical protein ACRC6M_00600 [Microcystaceae cyanobacterium]